MSSPRHELTVCICTFRRPLLLRRLLWSLPGQRRDPAFVLDVVVVDNDSGRSGQAVVQEARESLSLPIRYDVEPVQNISRARNRAVANAGGDLVAFIDDDERPAEGWLARLVECLDRSGADGVLGPVKPDFETPPPPWLVKSRLCERPSHESGTPIRQKDMRTGNALLRRALFRDEESPFDPRYGLLGGEDVDFFERQVRRGKTFVWCQDAVVHETVPPERLRRSYYLRRALTRGAANALKAPAFSGPTLKSLAAIGVYTLGLPFAFLSGQGRFMNLLVRYFDHLGRILGLIGLNPVRARPIQDLPRPDGRGDPRRASGG